MKPHDLDPPRPTGRHKQITEITLPIRSAKQISTIKTFQLCRSTKKLCHGYRTWPTPISQGIALL
ncbi:hypothetical protein [Shewanella cutis]|uniref:Uncharacterized protein n=1 Tax=Shewanella cutis TaxID=2766780 RepID=A0ABS9QV26_9GAMM|nr:hypothetical protein [Shewanella sp. PS-2]MCG9964213.1 hypothetical protein [Shewanella sp. PS-2]